MPVFGFGPRDEDVIVVAVILQTESLTRRLTNRTLLFQDSEEEEGGGGGEGRGRGGGEEEEEEEVLF